VVVFDRTVRIAPLRVAGSCQLPSGRASNGDAWPIDPCVHRVRSSTGAELRLVASRATVGDRPYTGSLLGGKPWLVHWVGE